MQRLLVNEYKACIAAAQFHVKNKRPSQKKNFCWGYGDSLPWGVTVFHEVRDLMLRLNKFIKICF